MILMRKVNYMPKNFNTIKRYLTDEEKFEEALLEYNCERFVQIKPVYIYPEGYHEFTPEEMEHDDEITQKIYEAEMNDDKAEADRLRELLTPIGPMPIINIEKTLELIPIEDRQYFIDELDKDSYEETVIMKCLKCDFEEEAPYDIIEECWMDGPYPIGYCPHCDKPKFVPLDIYNKKKKK